MHCGGKCAAVPVGPETRSSPDCLANAAAPLLGALQAPDPQMEPRQEDTRRREQGMRDGKEKKREKEEGMTKRPTA